MYALIDCNSFFCSVEKVFHPGLEGKPVCVLSSNDGCVVALTPEAKALGIRRGEPIFEVSDIVERNGVRVFSGNMMLYAAMSKRVQNIIRAAVDRVEVYSIDECFCDLSGYGKYFDIEGLMRDLAMRIRLYTDIPVSVGVAPTKTLAKAASKFAKKYPGYHSVCMMDTDEKRRKALALFDLADVWGVGGRSLQKLNYLGIHTPLEFADRNLGWVRSHFTKPGVQTWKELNGIPCIDTSEIIQRQSIGTSRSFGEMISDLQMLKASIATFAASCAGKLRAQNSVAGSVMVFIATNPFREDLPQYSNTASMRFSVATADTIEITQAALRLAESIYRPGYLYKRSGVMLTHISPDSALELDLFDPVRNRFERHELSRSFDALNQQFGLRSVQLAVAGAASDPWHVKSLHRSPNFLTSIDELLVVS
ncbi:MAG: Y-family DNA polymerase [Bacteroidales bacterium]|nr:Y-family DNA polymerase [Bacteroidales bacterium]